MDPVPELKGGVGVGERWEIRPFEGRTGRTVFRGKTERGSKVLFFN